MTAMSSLDNSIAKFLSTQSDTTREECDRVAHSILSANASPVSMQGCFSYTIADHSRLVQFRDPDFPLDIEVLRQARSIHGPLVPATTYHGQIGKGRPLLVYIIEKLPGITYMEYDVRSGLDQSLDEHQFKRQQTLVEDFARYFAASWKTPQAADMVVVRQNFERDLRLLAQTLPSRFSEGTLALLSSLDTILESLPMVLTHTDLSETNFLVEESSGHLTGIIDWAGAEVLPFGFGLWGLESLMGYMDLHSWSCYHGHADLRATFWTSFRSAIAEEVGALQGAVDLARRMGILFRYAFRRDENMQRRVIQEGESGAKFLDAHFL